jgi:hypothetical protein
MPAPGNWEGLSFAKLRAARVDLLSLYLHWYWLENSESKDTTHSTLG